jgi:2-dehydro-3-deoxyglucarate aldolase/4-hydroxy-2-oxoheptanedioate aldolase
MPYAEHVAHANAATLLAAQIETPGALAQLDAIGREAALDVLFVGPNDLSQALGIPGRFDDPRFGQALRHVGAAAAAAGRAAGVMVARREQIPELRQAGFRFFTVSDRTLVLDSARAWRNTVTPGA